MPSSMKITYIFLIYFLLWE